MNSPQHIHFVTGRLAEASVRTEVAKAAEQFSFAYTISVLPITVAALMTKKWLLRHLEIPAFVDRVVLPGYLKPTLEELRTHFASQSSTKDVVIDCGPKDIRDLQTYFGKPSTLDETYGRYSVEIIAEINHANRLKTAELLEIADRLRSDGANVIDVGCTPGDYWAGVAEAVRELRDAGHRVSIDSFDDREVSEACNAGAELVLSVNSTNCRAANDWGAEVVVIPDVPDDLRSLQDTVERLAKNDVRMRLDPILEPLGLGFAQSLGRYAWCRETYPDATMMMGIGNITEMTDVDSAGINVLLLGICEELGIQSVLTTQVINWARSSVRECDLARKLMHFAVTNRIPPKHVEPQLVALRDERLKEYDLAFLHQLAESVRDNNVRIINHGGKTHAISAGSHAHGDDPFAVMAALLASPVGPTIDVSHAFYLGFEMAKAMIANTLHKQYEQDQPLNWGYLTKAEPSHRLPRQSGRKRSSNNDNA